MHPGDELTLPKQALVFMCLQCKSFQNTFPTMFSTRSKNFLPFPSNFKLSSAKSFRLEESKLCPFGKGLSLLLPYG